MSAASKGTLERILDLHQCGVTAYDIAIHFGLLPGNVEAIIDWLT